MNVRQWFPEKVRRICATFRSPKWCKDPGPLRIVILDNRSNEKVRCRHRHVGNEYEECVADTHMILVPHTQAGIVPELQDKTEGRNSTVCPFVFTSREDFTDGVNRLWPIGRLTLHEGTHGMDMVVRQRQDPAFHFIVADAYKQAMENKIYQYYDEAKGQVVPLYAAASRDEYLAEAMTLYHDKPQLDGSNNYARAGLRNRADLLAKDPTIVRIIESYLT